MSAEQADFVDPFRDYGEVEADLATIEAWGRTNCVKPVDGRIRAADGFPKVAGGGP